MTLAEHEAGLQLMRNPLLHSKDIRQALVAPPTAVCGTLGTNDIGRTIGSRPPVTCTDVYKIILS